MSMCILTTGAPKRIGFISTRFQGTDGVTLEARKWAHILQGMGHSSFWMTGERSDVGQTTLREQQVTARRPSGGGVFTSAAGEVKAMEQTRRNCSRRSMRGECFAGRVAARNLACSNFGDASFPLAGVRPLSLVSRQSQSGALEDPLTLVQRIAALLRPGVPEVFPFTNAIPRDGALEFCVDTCAPGGCIARIAVPVAS